MDTMAKGCFRGFPFPDAIVRHCRFAASARNSLQIVALVCGSVENIEQQNPVREGIQHRRYCGHRITFMFPSLRFVALTQWLAWFVVTFIPVKLTFAAIVRSIRLP